MDQTNPHYACEGNCGGVSDKPGQCSAEGCSHYQKDLVECSCEDGNHNKQASSEE